MEEMYQSNQARIKKEIPSLLPPAVGKASGRPSHAISLATHNRNLMFIFNQFVWKHAYLFAFAFWRPAVFLVTIHLYLNFEITQGHEEGDGIVRDGNVFFRASSACIDASHDCGSCQARGWYNTRAGLR
jgi:hypothetical protein